VGAWPLLALTLTNQSREVVHSFMLRFAANIKGPASGIGMQPDQGLAPGATLAHTSQEPDGGCLAVCVDFVQFVSGDTWYSGHPDSLVTEAGVHAGSRAASALLQAVLERSGVAAVMAQLPRIHADVTEPITTRVDGRFGFYNGVTNVAVRLQHAFGRDGPGGVEARLRSDRTRD